MWLQYHRVEFAAPAERSVTDQTMDYIPGLGTQSNEMDNGLDGSNVLIRCLVRPPFAATAPV
jgi:hypothetical protein